ncbi:unnamed protein product [Adineta ricciae]|uniref:Alpha/beta hydrolase fold-3 domain-containing protein n=1 Tax=Adineta ricciae TaxID=249248 RepID=A0A814Q2L3_ADIRI|nr:unnamed protein product [Adineta ricciae]
MSSSGGLKKLIFVVVIAAVAVPLRYGSTNHKYLLVRLLHSTLTLKNCFVVDPGRQTLSPAYRAFEEMMKMSPPQSFVHSTNPLATIQSVRASFSFSDIIPEPSGCQMIKETFTHDGRTVDGYWIDHREKDLRKQSEQIILYFHGGGYMLGDINFYSGIECHLSRLFNVPILHLEYRLIPEHPVPSAVEDAITIYRSLLTQNVSPSRIVIMGDSAGGGLALLTVQSLINHKIPVPRGIVAIAPWTDFSASGESYTRNQPTDVMLRTDNTKWQAKVIMDTYGSKILPTDPIVSPLFGSFKGFPPLYVNVGTADILEDDGRAVVKKAQEAGVEVKFEAGLHMMHVYPLFFSYFPEARDTLDNINKWMQSI